MKQYIDLLKLIAEHGHELPDRTGTGRRKIFGAMMRFNLRDGFPLVTTRKIPFITMVKETLWFISGSSSNQDLLDNNVKIWDNWAVKEKHIDAFLAKHVPEHAEELKPAFMETALETVGPMYGEALRKAPNKYYNEFFPKVTEEDVEKHRFAEIKAAYENEAPKYEDGAPVPFDVYLQLSYYQEIDQLHNVIKSLKKRPFSSRHVINLWVPEFIPFEELSPQENVLIGKGALAHCHVMQQYLVLPPDHEGGKNRLSLMMTQRSADTPVGVPFNIAQYALLLSMIAQVVDMEPYEFIWSGGDCHIYLDQKDLIQEQVNREPRPLPKLWLNPEIKDLFDFTVDDIKILNYNPHDPINYPVSI